MKRNTKIIALCALPLAFLLISDYIRASAGLYDMANHIRYQTGSGPSKFLPLASFMFSNAGPEVGQKFNTFCKTKAQKKKLLGPGVRNPMPVVQQWFRDEDALKNGLPFTQVEFVNTNFSNVGGAHAAKQELSKVVNFIKFPNKYKNAGAKMPKGVLLYGPPGTGKTLLARAVAGEAGAPFLYATGSAFSGTIIGYGVIRIRALYETARTTAAKKGQPAIVFIDEFEALAGKRSMFDAHQDHILTLNQLLTELDGFYQSDEPIITMAATNMLDFLDPAAIRPGRFDCHVEVPLPDLIERDEILRVSMKGVAVSENLNIGLIARATQGFSGAGLAQLVNAAIMRAIAEGRKTATMTDFEAVRDKIIMGHPNSTLKLDQKVLWTTAYHEAGHALAILLMPQLTDPLYKITIEPHGSKIGFTACLPQDDKPIYSKDECLARIMVALAGRVGEELGTGEQFSGVSSDLASATAIARNMVCFDGMSDLGLVSLPTSNDKAVAEVNKIVANCYKKVKELFHANRKMLDRLAALLLKKGTLTEHEACTLLGIPSRTVTKF